ncbi:MAG: twin-arginine translocase subunit TatC [Chlorobiaceae bacterium]|nr:twin-arginine translocase subunit TatC [Chlorobiaceae bacterium]
MSNESESTIPPTEGNERSADSGNDLMRVPGETGTHEKKESPSTAADPDEHIMPAPPEPIPETAPEGLPEEESEETPDEETETQGMSFIDHLEEFRWRLVRGAVAFLVAAIACGYYADYLVNVVLIGPLKQSGPNIVLQNLVPYGQLSLYFQVVFFCAFVLSFPFLAWQIWKFVEPGLHEKERKASRFIILFISICFFTGIAFGYFVFMPISLKFFAGFGSPLIKNNIAVQDYISFFLGTLLTAGIVFELPFISYILSKIGFLTPAFMRFYRRHAVIAMLVTAAIVTPSTDMVTQLVIAVPMIILYEVSIYISAGVQRNKNRQLLQEHS